MNVSGLRGLFLFIFLLSPWVQGEELHRIDEIEVTGNETTDTEVILAELPFEKGENVSKDKIKEGLENIRNTGLFNNVTYEIDKGENRQRLKFLLEERWTLIPIAKAASGGGISQITLGLFDPNVFGKYIEAGFQYERLGDANSGVAWFKKPRLFGGRFGLDTKFWKTNRLCIKFDNDAQGAVHEKGFLQKRDKLYTAVSYEINGKTRSRLFYEFNKDQFTEVFLTDDIKALAAQTGLPSPSEFHFLGTNFERGRLNENNHLIDGGLFRASASYGVSATAGLSNFWQGELNYRFSRPLKRGATFAQRLMAGFTTTEILQYSNFLGGLDRIRGFSNNRFSGRMYWLSNTEYRHPLLRHDWMVLQGVGFFDVSRTGETLGELGQVGGASLGGGIRVVLPKVYRFVVRLDYAVPVVKTDEINVSFGVQQFF